MMRRLAKPRACVAATRYEALRQQVLASEAWSREGLSVLLRQGVAAWLEIVSQVPSPARRSTRAPRACSNSLPQGANAELVRLLVTMMLGHLGEVTA